MAKRDLTNGSLYRGILSLAIPMIASGTLQSIQNMVDLFFVNRLGENAVAAVGMSGQALMVLIAVFMGVGLSTVALISRAVGAKDPEHAAHVAGQSLLLSVFFSVCVGIVGFVFSTHILKALGAEPDVIELGTGYLHIIFSGVFFLCAAFVINGIFHASGDAVTPFVLGMIVTACNCVLNPLLIFGALGFPEMGVRGSAIATVIARILGFVVGMGLLLRGRLTVRLHRRNFDINLGIMWRILAIGIPGSMMMSVRTLMNLALMRIVSKFGTAVVAAYTIGLRIRMIALIVFFGFAGSAATMVGQNLGARQPKRSQRSAYIATGMAFASAVVMCLMLVNFAPWLIAAFNKKGGPEVLDPGIAFLQITSVGLLASSISIVLGRAMSGAGDTRSPFIISLICLWGFQIPAAVVFSGVRQMWGMPIPWANTFAGLSLHGETGVWVAIVAASVLQAIITSFWFALGRWKHKKV